MPPPARRLSPESVRATAILGAMVVVFLLAYFLPFQALPAGETRIAVAGREALLMLQDYAQHHVILCLVPALFIAGAISCFVSQAAVMKYLGPTAKKLVAYSVASVSGTILAVCSCTVLPLFAGIWTRGAGLGPASAFLYSGPAINVLAIILTARILGWEIGLARAGAAVGFSFIVGLAMHVIYRKEERAKAEEARANGGFVLPEGAADRPLWKTASYFAAMVGILVFANWARPAAPNALWEALFAAKWVITGVLFVALVAMLRLWFTRDELKQWVGSTWFFAKQILPLLFIGVLVSGVLLGRPGQEALIPNRWIEQAVGGNSLGANLFASVAGALMYFATLTEVPILQGLLGSGMGKGPALALLLAGPALSLPSMLVIRSVVGTQKMLVYVALVAVLSTVAGLVFGMFR
jgi:uncharacterized membrane protein YraQ (UPF0718 family)